MLELMRYLKNLTSMLPERQKTNFTQSDARLSMEYIIDTLEGKKGLFREIQTRKPRLESKEEPAAPAKPRPQDGPKKPQVKDIADTLAYLGKLASALKDRGLTTAISRKVNGVLSSMKQPGKEKKDHRGKPGT
jgi:hypothetical protein